MSNDSIDSPKKSKCIFRPDAVSFENESSVSEEERKWARGHYTEGAELIDAVLEQLRLESTEKDEDSEEDEQKSSDDDERKNSDDDTGKEIVLKRALPQLSKRRLCELQTDKCKVRKEAYADVTSISDGVSFVRETEGKIKDAYYLVECPHCGGSVHVYEKDIACRIFRHGVFKGKRGGMVKPHAKREECERLVKENKIVGCGKPFTFNGEEIFKCEYI